MPRHPLRQRDDSRGRVELEPDLGLVSSVALSLGPCAHRRRADVPDGLRAPSEPPMRYQDRRGRHPWGPWARRRRLAAMLGTLVTALLVEVGTGLGRWLL